MNIKKNESWRYWYFENVIENQNCGILTMMSQTVLAIYFWELFTGLM